MSLKYSSVGSSSFIASTRENINSCREAVRIIQRAVDNLVATVGTPGMQGRTYEAGGMVFREYIVPAMNEVNHWLDRMEGDLRTYTNADSSVNQYGYLDEKVLEELVRIAHAKLNMLHVHQQELHNAGINFSFSNEIELTQESIHTFNQMLDALRTFNAQTSNLFTDNSGLTHLNTIIGYLSSSTPSLQEVKMGVGYHRAMTSFAGDNAYKKRIKQVVAKIAKGKSKAYQQALQNRLEGEVSIMANSSEGWDKTAILGYLKFIQTHALKDSKKHHNTLNKTLKAYWKNLHQVGSGVYVKVFKSSKLKDSQKLDLMLTTQLDAQIDKNGFLQLNSNGHAQYHLAKKISPLSSFFTTMRQTVVNAYGKKGLKSAGVLSSKIHLFRTYLDRSYIQYIREYDGKKHNLGNNATDYQRLQEFMKDYHVEADYTTGANLHNRTHPGQFKYPVNMKVQLTKNSNKRHYNSSRMVEFIVNIKSGKFVSEWNAYDKHMVNGHVNSDTKVYSDDELYQVANTESFNYGMPRGAYSVPSTYAHTHDKLDVKHPKDPNIRKLATAGKLLDKDDNLIDWRLEYVSEKDITADSQGGNFINIVSGGGYQDVKIWNSIPDNQKQSMYDNYVKWIKKRDFNNRKRKGFDYYYHKLMGGK